MPYRTWATNDVLNAADMNAMTADAQMGYVDTSEGTTSTTYTDLTTSGPSATISLVNGQGMLIFWSARMGNDTAGAFGAQMSFAVTGGLTRSADDQSSTEHTIDESIQLTGVYWAVATSTASTTVTAKYRRTGASGTATFLRRRIVIKKF